MIQVQIFIKDGSDELIIVIIHKEKQLCRLIRKAADALESSLKRVKISLLKKKVVLSNGEPLVNEDTNLEVFHHGIAVPLSKVRLLCLFVHLIISHKIISPSLRSFWLSRITKLGKMVIC